MTTRLPGIPELTELACRGPAVQCPTGMRVPAFWWASARTPGAFRVHRAPKLPVEQDASVGKSEPLQHAPGISPARPVIGLKSNNRRVCRWLISIEVSRRGPTCWTRTPRIFRDERINNP